MGKLKLELSANPQFGIKNSHVKRTLTVYISEGLTFYVIQSHPKKSYN